MVFPTCPPLALEISQCLRLRQLPSHNTLLPLSLPGSLLVWSQRWRRHPHTIPLQFPLLPVDTNPIEVFSRWWIRGFRYNANSIILKGHPCRTDYCIGRGRSGARLFGQPNLRFCACVWCTPRRRRWNHSSVGICAIFYQKLPWSPGLGHTGGIVSTLLKILHLSRSQLHRISYSAVVQNIGSGRAVPLMQAKSGQLWYAPGFYSRCPAG